MGHFARDWTLNLLEITSLEAETPITRSLEFFNWNVWNDWNAPVGTGLECQLPLQSRTGMPVEGLARLECLVE